jgi:phosphoserine aminotransferase
MNEKRIFNFHPGPATLPREVMLQAQAEFVNFRGIGYGVLEESHRSPLFIDVAQKAEQNIRDLLGLDDSFSVLFLQGGASLQFAMVPMNLTLPGKPALYANTGYWAGKAIKEAKLLGDVKVVFDGKAHNYSRIGDPSDWDWSGDASYAYICTNNTIYGSQYHFFPDTGATPLVADMSSDIMSRPVDIKKFSLIFAGAQKNLGPSGVTLVVLRKDLAARVAEKVPTMLKYATHIEAESMYNTPPTFGIYLILLVTEWLKAQGGLTGIERINTAKSQAIYQFIDDSNGFYRGTVEAGDRSKMNVTFRLPSEELEARFVKEATAHGLIGLKGHRAVGGVRASLYNAMELEGVSRLIDFMEEFQRRAG